MALLSVVVSGCATGPPAGTFRADYGLRTGIYGRSLLVHLPAGYSAGSRYPLVVVLHGAFSTGREMEETSGWSRLADREGFVAIYPEGIGLFGFLQHWNAGHCCGKAVRDGWDDMAFLRSSIERVCGDYAIDRARVYMVGMSNGGMMTHRFAAEQPGTLAAAAVVSGAIGSRESPEVPEWSLPVPGSPVPMLIMHGTADKSVPYDGGKRQDKEDTRVYRSVADAVAFWRAANHATNGPARAAGGGGMVTEDSWSDAGRNEVRLCTVLDWGHKWPGPHFTAQMEPGNPLRSYDATAVIWDFFARNRQPAGRRE